MTTDQVIYLGSIPQGLLARHIYSIKFTDAKQVSSPAVVVTNKAGQDRKSTVMPAGEPTAEGNAVILPAMLNLALVDEVYRVIVTATVDGQGPSRVFLVTPVDENNF